MTSRFIHIIEALGIKNRKLNLTGVVGGTSISAKSKGPDYYCTLDVYDESWSCPGIPVTFFSTNMEGLPRPRSAGDIIQLYQVVVRSFGRDVHAVFYKDSSSFALFEGKNSNNFVPYQFSLKFGESMIGRKPIIDLRNLLISGALDTGTNHLSSMTEIKEGVLNLVCKVLHACEVRKDVWMLYVWDGTDAPSVPIQAKLEDEGENPVPLQLEENILSRDILKKFPTVGTVLRVSVDQSKEKLGLHYLNGMWVKFFKLKCEIHGGFWRGELLRCTKLGYMNADADVALQCLSVYNKREHSSRRRMPLECFPRPSNVTEVDDRDASFLTLMDVLTHSEVTDKFRCAVRVLAIYPWQPEYFRNPNGKYRIRLTLEDPTARIHAFLDAENGDKFFGGYPSVEVVRKKRNVLLGVGENDNGEESDAPRNPPWVQCSILSYYADKSDQWGTRWYKIFGTRMTI